MNHQIIGFDIHITYALNYVKKQLAHGRFNHI